MKKRRIILPVLATVAMLPAVATGETADALWALNNPELLTSTPDIGDLRVYDTTCIFSSEYENNKTFSNNTFVIFNDDGSVFLRNLPFARIDPYVFSDYQWVQGTYDKDAGRIRIDEGTVFAIGRWNGLIDPVDRVESALLRSGGMVTDLSPDDIIHAPMEFTVGDDCEIVFDNLGGTALMGAVTGRGEVSKRAVSELSMRQSSLVPVLPPPGLPVLQYQMSYNSIQDYPPGSTARRVRVAIDGDDIYIQGLEFDDMWSWVRGTLSDGKVVFPHSQYMASGPTGWSEYLVPCTYSWSDAYTRGENYIVMTPSGEDFVMGYNAATGKLWADEDTFVMVGMSPDSEMRMLESLLGTYRDIDVFGAPVLTPVPDGRQVPRDPEVEVSRDGTSINLTGSGYDTAGNVMYYTCLYFRLWVNGEPHIFSTDDNSFYSVALFEPTTDLPFSKLLSVDTCNDWQRYTYTVNLPDGTVAGDVRAEVIYKFGEEEENSVGAIFDQPEATLPDDITYDLTGRSVNSDNLQPGIYIRNGKKIMVRK